VNSSLWGLEGREKEREREGPRISYEHMCAAVVGSFLVSRFGQWCHGHVSNSQFGGKCACRFGVKGIDSA